jgi:hypothetical protein
MFVPHFSFFDAIEKKKFKNNWKWFILNFLLTKITFIFIFLLTFSFLGEGDPGNSEFGREVSKVWPRIISIKKRTHIFPNDSS